MGDSSPVSQANEGTGTEFHTARAAHLLEGLQVAYPGPEFATAYGHLFADLERSGQRLAAMDHLIATSALVDGASLATADSDDFSRVPRLAILSY